MRRGSETVDDRCNVDKLKIIKLWIVKKPESIFCEDRQSKPLSLSFIVFIILRNKVEASSIIFHNHMKKNKKQQPKQVFLERIKCGCVAQKHDLVNNCLGCGKVVCAQEG